MSCRVALRHLTDQGILRVELLDGKEIHGIDRGGLSLILLVVGIILNLQIHRQIGSVCCFLSQWTKGFQVADKEKDPQSGVE